MSKSVWNFFFLDSMDHLEWNFVTRWNRIIVRSSGVLLQELPSLSYFRCIRYKLNRRSKKQPDNSMMTKGGQIALVWVGQSRFYLIL